MLWAIQKNVLPAAAGSTFMQNHVNNLKKLGNVTSHAPDGKYDAYMCGLCGAHGGT